MRASELLGQPARDHTTAPVGRIIDLVAHPDPTGELMVNAAIVTPGRRGRLLGYERPALQRPWPLRKLAEWLHRGIREIPLAELRDRR